MYIGFLPRLQISLMIVFGSRAVEYEGGYILCTCFGKMKCLIKWVFHACEWDLSSPRSVHGNHLLAKDHPFSLHTKTNCMIYFGIYFYQDPYLNSSYYCVCSYNLKSMNPPPSHRWRGFWSPKLNIVYVLFWNGRNLSDGSEWIYHQICTLGEDEASFNVPYLLPRVWGIHGVTQTS